MLTGEWWVRISSHGDLGLHAWHRVDNEASTDHMATSRCGMVTVSYPSEWVEFTQQKPPSTEVWFCQLKPCQEGN